jgi:large subunit ribosomal protein L35
VPKMKTKKSLKRRIKVTGTGKLMRYRGGRRHLQSGKSANRRRRLRKPAHVPKGFVKAYMQLISPSL